MRQETVNERRLQRQKAMSRPVCFHSVADPLSGALRADDSFLDLSNLDWHMISPEEIQKRWRVDISQGLSHDQVQQRVREFGKNALSPLPHQWFWQIFGYFFKGFGGILLIGCILVFISWKPLGQPPAPANLALAIVLLAVFFIQAGFNAWQDWSSTRVMASITAMLPESCLVLRDSSLVVVSAPDIVPGDVVHLKAGNKLPADVRLVEVSNDVCFDRSILTGTLPSEELAAWANESFRRVAAGQRDYRFHG